MGKDEFVMVGMLSLLLAVVLLISTGVTYVISVAECASYSQVTGVHTEHGGIANCYIEDDGEMVHWSVYKARNIAKGFINE